MAYFSLTALYPGSQLPYSLMAGSDAGYLAVSGRIQASRGQDGLYKTVGQMASRPSSTLTTIYLPGYYWRVTLSVGTPSHLDRFTCLTQAVTDVHGVHMEDTGREVQGGPPTRYEAR